MSLFLRVFVLNAAIFVVGTLVLALSPATVSFPVEVTEAIVLVFGLTALLVVNLVVVRITLAPLDRLATLMRRADLLSPGRRLSVSGPAEVQELGRVFNEMLDRLERERRESGRRALAAQEAERTRVARELHDEIGQSLTGVLLLVTDLATRVPPELRETAHHAQEAARASLDDVRRVARQLRPDALDHLGLASAFAALTNRFAEQTGVKVERRVEELPELDAEAELVLYRVAQESLTNVARHAGASTVELSVVRAGERVELRVRDDGRGLDGASPGDGIQGMRERALSVGGELVVGVCENGGVEVRLRVPIGASK